jgi:Icc-related predicted phosphoesterase
MRFWQKGRSQVSTTPPEQVAGTPLRRDAVRICCVADLHGRLPADVPECDLLLIAGDIGAYSIGESRRFLELALSSWIGRQPVGEVIAVAGNHDRIAERDRRLMRRLPFRYLENQVIERCGLKIAGSPCSVGMFGAFAREDYQLARLWRSIPADTDILLVHTPPYGLLDLARNGNHLGSQTLRDVLSQLPDLQLVVCGHVHESAGVLDLGPQLIVNASLVNEHYERVNKPVLVDVVPRIEKRGEWRK